MRLFSLTKEIAIDLGTANTVIIHNDKIVIDEPSIVALDRRTDKLIAVKTNRYAPCVRYVKVSLPTSMPQN